MPRGNFRECNLKLQRHHRWKVGLSGEAMALQESRGGHMSLDSIGNEDPDRPNPTKPLWYQPGIAHDLGPDRGQSTVTWFADSRQWRSPGILPLAVTSWPARRGTSVAIGPIDHPSQGLDLSGSHGEFPVRTKHAEQGPYHGPNCPTRLAEKDSTLKRAERVAKSSCSCRFAFPRLPRGPALPPAVNPDKKPTTSVAGRVATNRRESDAVEFKTTTNIQDVGKEARYTTIGSPTRRFGGATGLPRLRKRHIALRLRMNAWIAGS
ncbi:hypothetical protein QBC47DRAFT_464805 [Echria macrotheca]|uniref:Uncharacterized protein n=1 Tax=Echria macrotheca TaxID=438768 RepID=A0AAJ0F4Q4_9PEZI|nr:hypothetical protein QBC47DRAFT_464805 [Echria macrotheca]